MAAAAVRIGPHKIGPSEPVFVIGEIGINHNGSIDIAKKMIEGAAFAGCAAVKFQKRTPEACVPRDQWDVSRETPWGRMTYIEYRRRMEFGEAEFTVIDRFCRDKGILWFASCWDEESVEFLTRFDPPLYKSPSASLTDAPLMARLRTTGRPLIVSTGMSELQDIERAVAFLGTDDLLIAHATSAYPCRVEELNLQVIPFLRAKFPGVPVGYSGHEVGLVPTWAAVALGACFVERHITLDRAMWGTDQAASVEILGMHRLVRDIRDIEKAMGDGIKRIYESERISLQKLRRRPVFEPALAICGQESFESS
jgi:N-acetylneuraminate synthase